MFTLSQTTPLENYESTIYMVHAPELEDKYQNLGYQRYERSYKLKYQHKEYTVLCPEYRNGEKNTPSIVIIPVFLIPRRPYPVHVYLYGVDLYSCNPAMGQREAAEATRKLFGLTHFAHTTLGRALKRFVRNVEETTGVSGECCNDELCESGNENVIQHSSEVKCEEHKNDVGEQSGFPTTQTTASWRKRAARFLVEKIGFTAIKQFIEVCSEFAKEWFKGYCRFLL